MSCFTTVSTRLTNAETIKAAAAALGYEVFERTRVRGWGSRTSDVEFVLRAGEGEVGVVRQKDGTYGLVSDWGHWGLSEQEFANRLAQKVGYVHVLAVAKKNRFTVAREETDETGTVRLVLRKFV